MNIRPRHILLFILSCLLLLGAVSYSFTLPLPFTKHLSFPTLTEVLDLPTPPSVPSQPSVPSLPSPPSPPSSVADTLPSTPLPSTPLPSTPLSLFRAALAESSTRQVRVMHYGDSQIEEDRITNNIRRHLQSQYGGSGTGWIQVPQYTPSITTTLTVRMNDRLVTRKFAPKRYTVFGSTFRHRPNDNHYSAFGQVMMMDTTLQRHSDELLIHIEPLKDNQPVNRFSQIRVLTRGNIEVNGLTQDILYYPNNTTTCDIELTGQGDVYGISLESTTGVIVDNVPMRGAIGNIFTKMNEDQLRAFYAETNTRLIILQFGGNVMPGTKSSKRIYGYIKTMRRQIAFLRRCAPEASIVFIGPSDMLTTIDGIRQSYPFVALLDEQLAKMTAEENVGYFSLYQAMGGQGGMEKWQLNGWAAKDGVHFTRKGAYQAGELFWQWLEEQLQQPATSNL